MKIITRSQAIEQGDQFYFTGKQCKNGHVTIRRTANGVCVDCSLDEQSANQKRRRERFNEQHGSEYHKQKSKKHYDANKQAYIDRAKKWNSEHQNCVREINKKWRERNRGYMTKYLANWRKRNPHKIAQYRLNPYTKIAQMNWRYSNKGLVNFYTRLRLS